MKNMSGTDFEWSELGQRIRDLRTHAGMTQQQVAAAACLSQPGLHQIETGATNPQLETLQRIAGVLGVSVRSLLIGTFAEQKGSGDPKAEDLVRRLRRILASGDLLAIRSVRASLEAAEALLDVSSRSQLVRRRIDKPEGFAGLNPTPGRKVVRVLKGGPKPRSYPGHKTQ